MKTFFNYVLVGCVLFCTVCMLLILTGNVKLPAAAAAAVPGVAATETASAKPAATTKVPEVLEDLRTEGLKGDLALSQTIQQWTVDGQPVRVKVLLIKSTGYAVLKTNAQDDPASLLPAGVQYVLAPHPRFEGKQLIGIPESEAAKFN